MRSQKQVDEHAGSYSGFVIVCRPGRHYYTSINIGGGGRYCFEKSAKTWLVSLSGRGIFNWR
jgi:hypothetical protein